MLDVSHNYWLVLASLAVALMAGFTGLSLTRGASDLAIEKRKFVIALAAISLGGGIWSMHFVAMLGLQLPVVFYYDPLITLMSALIAILVVGLALLLLHFAQRTSVNITIAGVIVGIGILAMHYVGMSGIRLCAPVYTASGILIAGVASILLSVAAIWVAYGHRTHRNIVLGTVVFGVAVFTVHFVAMAGTSFVDLKTESLEAALLSNETLAFFVAIGAFIICGSFLLNSVTFLPADSMENSEGASQTDTDGTEPSDADTLPKAEGVAQEFSQVPYERNGKTYFIDPAEIVAVRAEGHYTMLYSQKEKLFCPWSISQAAERLPTSMFIQSHRSYLINATHVSSFERKKDNGICYFEDAVSLKKAPVSRSRLADVREILGLT